MSKHAFRVFTQAAVFTVNRNSSYSIGAINKSILPKLLWSSSRSRRPNIGGWKSRIKRRSNHSLIRSDLISRGRKSLLTRAVINETIIGLLDLIDGDFRRRCALCRGRGS